ncbi:hypothetical protein Tco_0004042 [Tanacetum coccineum]
MGIRHAKTHTLRGKVFDETRAEVRLGQVKTYVLPRYQSFPAKVEIVCVEMASRFLLTSSKLEGDDVTVFCDDVTIADLKEAHGRFDGLTTEEKRVRSRIWKCYSEMRGDSLKTLYICFVDGILVKMMITENKGYLGFVCDQERLHALAEGQLGDALSVLINGQYCFPPSEVYNEVLDSEMELDAIVDELSKQCADLVLEEPVSYFTIEANGFFGSKRIESNGQGDGVINTTNNGHMFPPTTMAVYDTKNQILEDEEEDTCIEEENTLRKDSTKGSAVEDGCSGLSEREKKIVIYIKKYIVENPTKLSDQVASEFSLPQEWPYEY